ncbi:MAG: hypothetical protein KAY47_01590 [Prevotella sp.]|nr:hypothetical protein [Prevotella sp.]
MLHTIDIQTASPAITIPNAAAAIHIPVSASPAIRIPVAENAITIPPVERAITIPHHVTASITVVPVQPAIYVDRNEYADRNEVELFNPQYAVAEEPDVNEISISSYELSSNSVPTLREASVIINENISAGKQFKLICVVDGEVKAYYSN